MALPSANAPVYTTAEIRELETRAAVGLPAPGLMERAGRAAAEIARRLAAGGRVLVVAGPGNNGGDAFVVARHLKSWWFDVDIVFTGEAARLPQDARAAFDALRAPTAPEIPTGRSYDLVVDGLFGIGLQRDITGTHARLVAAINALDTRVLALDLPSGLASDSGRVLGCAVRADHTATFIALKPGLLTADGPDHCGEIHLCDLGLDAAQILAARGALLAADSLAVLPTRARNSHKGTYGSVGIAGGAAGMVGAALLAGRAALQTGAGRVYLGLLDAAAPRLDPLQPELMLRDLDGLRQVEALDCLAVGPGLGNDSDARACVADALARDLPLVIDADALNLIAADSVLQRALATRRAPTVLTPHPAEAARLVGFSTAAVQSDRVATACGIAAQFRAYVVLKGAGSVCAAPDGRWWINTSGNPGMASAGMGDVLTGMVAALIAQGVTAEQALLAAVHLHGAAADALVAAGEGPIGLTAGEVARAARRLLNR